MSFKTTPMGILTRQSKVDLMTLIVSRVASSIHLVAMSVKVDYIDDSLIQNVTVEDENGHRHYLTLTLSEKI